MNMGRIRGSAVADKSIKRLYNRGMRIGIDCRLPTYRMGGISQYVLNLLPFLAELDVENEYIILHSRKEQRSFLPSSAVKWRRRNLWTPPHHRYERLSLSAELAPIGLDVLHSPDFIPPQSGARRRVITIHDLTFVFYPELLTEESRRYYLDQIQWAAETADLISVDSFATRRDVIELLKVAPEKVTAVHLAANPLYSREVAQDSVQTILQKYGVTPGFLLSVGTIEPRKNLPMLLRIYARLRGEQGIKDPLLLVGRKGWLYEDVFATIGELGLEPYVVHFESVDDDDLFHLYHAAGALVTPSLYEGFGLPALEAQLCGCPAVVSDRGSLPEIVGEQGLIVALEDEDAWVETLARIMQDREFREQATAQGRVQAANFSWERTAKQTLALYLGQEAVPAEQKSESASSNSIG